jgi:hypothetical protein
MASYIINGKKYALDKRNLLYEANISKKNALFDWFSRWLKCEFFCLKQG